jgi:hypothetical protein
MKRIKWMAVILFIAGGIAAVHAPAQPLKFEPVECSGAAATIAAAVSETGLVGGSYITPEGEFVPFLWDGGQCVPVPVPPELKDPALPVVYLSAVNNRRQMLVAMLHTEGYHAKSFLVQNGVWTPILPAEDQVIATGLNEQGIAVGILDRNPDPYLGPDYGFVRATDGTVTLPPGPFGEGRSYEFLDIANNGNIVGMGCPVDGKQVGFIRKPDGSYTVFSYIMDDGTPAPTTEPMGINAREQVVGVYFETPGPDTPYFAKGFLREPDGSMTQVRYPGAVQTSAFKISASGVVVGTWTDSTGKLRGYRARKETLLAP